MMDILITSPRYADPTHTLYDVTVTLDGATINYTVSPDDDAPMAVAIREAMAADPLPIADYVAPPPRPRRLSAYRIVRRIEEAGMIEAASAYLDAHPALRWRFQTADSQGGILVDDPDLLAGLADLGLTEPQVEALLAPE